MPFLKAFLTFWITFALFSCQEHYNPIDHNTPLAKDLFSAPEARGKVNNPLLNEVSGLAASINFPGAFWVHNDSGGKNELYLIAESGDLLGTLILKGASNRDWEDIAIGIDSLDKKSYLYVAETGDNEAKYPDRCIYRLAEPENEDLSSGFLVEAKDVKKIPIAFPDGRRDAETLLFDPLGQELLIVSKREDSVRFYSLPKIEASNQAQNLNYLGKLHFHNANGGDISPDGREILIKNYANIYHWTRKPQESIAQALARKPQRLLYEEEAQGEAIAWARDGSNYYTLSEFSKGIEPVLYQYRRKNKD